MPMNNLKMKFYEVVKEHEGETRAITLSKCYENKLLYNCKYDSVTEQRITNYLEKLIRDPAGTK